MYIEYLNNIQISQLFSWKMDTTTWTSISWDVVDLTGDTLYDSDMQSDIFGWTWVNAITSDVSGSMNDESYGFVKNLETTWEKVVDSSAARMVSSGAADVLTWDSKDQLKNLLLREE